MNIESYIVQLLFDHQCVILPGLGGFVVNQQSAVIDPIKVVITNFPDVEFETLQATNNPEKPSVSQVKIFQKSKIFELFISNNKWFFIFN